MTKLDAAWEWFGQLQGANFGAPPQVFHRIVFNRENIQFHFNQNNQQN